MENTSRRKFIKSMSVAGSVSGAARVSGFATSRHVMPEQYSHSPRVVWIASMTQEGMTGNTVREVIDGALHQMEIALPNSPDIICLPEVFHVAGVRGG